MSEQPKEVTSAYPWVAEFIAPEAGDKGDPASSSTAEAEGTASKDPDPLPKDVLAEGMGGTWP
jgi:hypothetical protein